MKLHAGSAVHSALHCESGICVPITFSVWPLQNVRLCSALHWPGGGAGAGGEGPLNFADADIIQEVYSRAWWLLAASTSSVASATSATMEMAGTQTAPVRRETRTAARRAARARTPLAGVIRYLGTRVSSYRRVRRSSNNERNEVWRLRQHQNYWDEPV